MRVSMAAPPASTRRTKPPAMARTSTMTTCLMASEYASWRARYPTTATSSIGLVQSRPSAKPAPAPHDRTYTSAKAPASPPTASNAAARRATPVPSSPEASGRNRFSGCRRSLATSTRSFSRYTALEIAQNRPNVTAVAANWPDSPSCLVRSSAANTNAFLLHCRGRIATRSASGTGRRGRPAAGVSTGDDCIRSARGGRGRGARRRRG